LEYTEIHVQTSATVQQAANDGEPLPVPAQQQDPSGFLGHIDAFNPVKSVHAPLRIAVAG
jgi:hypothetical protein